MESTLNIYPLSLGTVTAMMFCGWLVSLSRKNVNVADSLWGMGFVLIAWISFAASDSWTGRNLLLALLTTIWGARLTIYMIQRNRGKAEDKRYASWRKEHGESFDLASLYKVFLVQALFLWLISLSIQHGIMSKTPERFTLLDALGTFVWGAGFVIETVADRQLCKFKSDPSNKGKVMDSGLWGYSRHPNYFGETLVWWGIFIIVLSTPGSLWTVISPLTITVVLLKMTGVALTEKSILESKPHYSNYMKKTSAFIPWPPKKNLGREKS